MVDGPFRLKLTIFTTVKFSSGDVPIRMAVCLVRPTTDRSFPILSAPAANARSRIGAALSSWQGTSPHMMRPAVASPAPTPCTRWAAFARTRLTANPMCSTAPITSTSPGSAFSARFPASSPESRYATTRANWRKLGSRAEAGAPGPGSSGLFRCNHPDASAGIVLWELHRILAGPSIHDIAYTASSSIWIIGSNIGLSLRGWRRWRGTIHRFDATRPPVRSWGSIPTR